MMKTSLVCLFASLALGALAGCQQNDTTRKPGSYTAARRNQTGSHIPQPYSADSTNSTMDTDTFMRDQQRMNSSAGSMGNNGMGGGAR